MNRTISHPQTKSVNIIYNNPSLLLHIKNYSEHIHNSANFINTSNLNATGLFKIIGEQFLDKLVFVLNADVYPGEGFAKVLSVILFHRILSIY